MCTEDFFLSLKANQELFNFVQQATMLLTFASGVLCYFAFKKNDQLADIQDILQGVSLGLWAFTLLLYYTVVMSYMKERRYSKERNVWGETIYQTKVTKTKQKRKSLVGSSSREIRSRGSNDSAAFIVQSMEFLKTNASDVIVNMHMETRP